VVTSRLLEAFPACPVKCYLLSEGELPAGSEYSAWAAAREECYPREGIRTLTSKETSLGIVFLEPSMWKRESWRFAIGATFRAQAWEAEVALMQRIPHTGAPSRFVFIRFVANNSLSTSDKTTKEDA